MERSDRERAEAGRRWAPKRVLRNWEYLVGAAVRADPEVRDHSAQAEIEAVMEAADVICVDDIDVARILYEYACHLAGQLDSLSERRGVLQFKSALKVAMTRQRQNHIGRSEDFWAITNYCTKLKNENIENLEAEEQAAREGRAPEGEDPSYQALRTATLTGFYEVFNILNNAAKFLRATVESEVGSGGTNSPFHHLCELVVDLHRQLFTTNVVSYRERPSLEVIKTTAATFSKPHDETLARDLEQILNANTPIKKSRVSKIVFKISGLYERITYSMVPKHISSMPMAWPSGTPMAWKLLNLCVREVQKSAEYLSREGAGVAYVMNVNQCYLLVKVLTKTEKSLASINQAQLRDVNPILVLGELLQTLHDAQMLIEASCIFRTESQWPREAFEQGDMNHTFLRVLYEVEWHTAVLLRMVAFGISQNNGVEFLIQHDGQPRGDVKTAQLEAMESDKESLKHRLKSMKVADPTEQGLAHQLLNRMEAPSSDLVFLNLDGFDHKGAPHIGSGSFGAVVKTNFLGRQCAMKVIEGIRGHEDDFEKETDAAKKLGNHPHLVRLHCYSKRHDACYLIMEELQMDLAKVLRLKNMNGEGLSMVEAVALMLQIGEGLKHIHSKEAAHRDLKPGNILVNLADPSSKYLSRIQSVKIADFGLTKTQAAVITCSNHTRNRGTSVYMAPEVMKSGGEDDPGSTRFNPAKADVFSFGVLCSEILTGETPYKGILAKQMKEQVKAGTLRPNLPTNCPPRLTNLLKKCWAGDYKERPLLPEVCKELRYIKALLLMFMDVPRHRSFC